MERAPCKQPAPDKATQKTPAESTPYYAHNPESIGSKRLRTAKVNAEKLADDLIKDNKTGQLIEILVEAHLEWHKLRHNSAGPETLADLEMDTSECAEHMIEEGDIEAVRSCYIHSALRVCCLQIHRDKLEFV
jgi:hypothetical protein